VNITEQYNPVLYRTVQGCTVQYSAALYLQEQVILLRGSDDVRGRGAKEGRATRGMQRQIPGPL